MPRRSNGLRVLMVGLSNPPPTFIERQMSALESLGVQVLQFPEFNRHKYLSHALVDRGIFVHLSPGMRELFRDADLIHFQWPGHLMRYYPLAKQANKPILVSLRGRQINIVPYLPANAAYVKRLRRTLPLCDAYHCVSANIMSQAQDFGLQPERAYVIRPAVDASFFFYSARLLPDDPIRLLMVGGLIWRKGYEYALSVMKRLVDEGMNVHLTIAGEGNERDRIQYTIQDLGLHDRVLLVGKVDPNQVRDLMHNSHVFIHTALSEGIANVVLEAMACGLPVVSFSCGGMNEVIEHGKDGFLAQTREIENVVAYVIDLAKHPKLRHGLGQAARHKVEEQFELKDQGRKFLGLYKRLIER